MWATWGSLLPLREDSVGAMEQSGFLLLGVRDHSSRLSGRRPGDMNTNRQHSWNESCRHHRHLPPIVGHPLVRRPYQSRFALGLIRGTGGRGKRRNGGDRRRRR